MGAVNRYRFCIRSLTVTRFAFARALFFGVGRLTIVCAVQRLSSQIEKLRTVANATQADSGRRQ